MLRATTKAPPRGKYKQTQVEPVTLTIHKHEQPNYRDISEEYIISYDEHHGRALVLNTGIKLTRCKACAKWVPEHTRDTSVLGICTKWRDESRHSDFCSYGEAR